MFSGLGSLDLNSTFASLSSTLSLDSMQSRQEEAAVTTKQSGTSKDGEMVEELRILLKSKDEDISILRTSLADQDSRLVALRDQEHDIVSLGKYCKSLLSAGKETGNKPVEAAVYSNGALNDLFRDILQLHKQAMASVCQSELNNNFQEELSATHSQLSANEKALKRASDKVKQLQAKLRSKTDELDQLLGSRSDTEVVVASGQCAGSEDGLLEKLRAQLSLVEENSTAQEQRISELESELEAANQAKSALIVCQNDMQKLEEECQSHVRKIQRIEAETAELATERNELQVGMAQAHRLIADQQQQLQALAVVEQMQKEKLDELQAELLSTIAMRDGEVQRAATLGDDLCALQKKYEQLVSRSDELIAELAQQKDELVQTSLNIVSAQQEASKRNSVVVDLESKIAGLTDKLRELMQKYADVKNKHHNAEHALDALRVESERSLASKESEIVKSHLKLEAAEQQAAEYKGKFADLVDKYGETQRALADLKQIHQCLAADHAGCLNSRTDLQSLQEEFDRSMAERSEQLHSLEASYQQQLQEAQEQGAKLQTQLYALQQNARSEMESASMFENYKKRAQLSLKKANSTISALTEENSGLKAEEGKLHERNSDLLQQVDLLRSELAVTLGRAAADKADLNRRVKSLEEKLVFNAEEMEVLQKLLVEMRRNQQLELGQQLSKGQPMHSAAPESKTSELVVQHAHEVPNTHVAPTVVPASAKVAADPSPSSSEPKSENSHASPEAAVLSMNNDGNASHKYVLIDELQVQAAALKKELSQRGAELETAHKVIEMEKDERNKLQQHCDDLMAYLERLKKLHDHPDSAINVEYLKNCIFRFMASVEDSERKRLCPVIATILNFTPREKAAVEENLMRIDRNDHKLDQALTDIGSSLETWFGIKPSSFFSSGT